MSRPTPPFLLRQQLRREVRLCRLFAKEQMRHSEQLVESIKGSAARIKQVVRAV